MKYIIGILLVCCLSCRVEAEYSSKHNNQLNKDDTTTSKVIKHNGEERKDSVDRWLWNIMTSGSLSYKNQLKATNLWLLMNKHIEPCRLMPEEE